MKAAARKLDPQNKDLPEKTNNIKKQYNIP